MSKIPALVNQVDARTSYRDDVLKCIKETILEKSIDISRKYEPNKICARKISSFGTCVNDEEKLWLSNFDRRRKNLSCGFFADRTKPYQTVGTVYLESGELVLNSITENLKSQLVRPPCVQSTRGVYMARRKQTSQQKKRPPSSPLQNRLTNPEEAHAGFAVIKRSLNDVAAMKKRVQAEQSLFGYLQQKEEELNVVEEEERLEMNDPYEHNWKKLLTIARTVNAFKRKHNQSSIATDGSICIDSTHSKLKSGNKDIKNAINLGNPEDKDKLLRRWKKKMNIEYLQTKLESINSLFCALFNMKAKLLRLYHPLAYKTVKELFRSDIGLDMYGKPTGGKFLPNIVVEDYSATEDVRAQESATEQHAAKRESALLALLHKRTTSWINAVNNKRAKQTQISSRFGYKTPDYGPRVETWEDLLNAGERNKQHPSLKPAMSPNLGKKHSRIWRRENAGSIQGHSVETNQPPWTTVEQTENMIKERKTIAVVGNAPKKTARDTLHDLRIDFLNLQRRLASDMAEELKRRQKEQLDLVRTKSRTIHLGYVASTALKKMRVDANSITRARRESTAKPLQWYLDLETEIYNQVGYKNEQINELLTSVARFQFEDDRSISHGKEKLCLLTMSIPIHQLLTRGMIDAIWLLLDKVLSSTPELLQHWLVLRKINTISQTPKTDYVYI